MRARRETMIVGALCAAWYTLSSASNVVGKLVLTEFPFPVTVTLVQLLSTVVYSAPAFAVAGVRRAPSFPLRFYWRVLVPLAFAKFLTTMFSQVSIWKVPISYAHTVKATTPLWTAGLAYALFGERAPRSVQAALLLLAAGVALASATELHFDGLGLGAALAAAALLSLQHLYSKRVMRDTAVHHLRLLQMLSGIALVPVVPVWALSEGAAALGAWGAGGAGGAGGAWGAGGARTAALLAADGALAWLQAVAAFSVLSRVSPLAYAVASAAKRAAVVLASLLLLRNPAPPLNLLGMALALLGVLAYNRAKLRNPAAPLLPV
ncbi:solute carrier family 35 member E1 homolog [Colias croceus]|uniref:solute carrier family 35 member E1 homolog n=1 Tax=Colias crocea TaxID=72248 RepID=UPI001E27A490|nr:solute carrier family 35 member E1 homolog [Colias croceus]